MQIEVVEQSKAEEAFSPSRFSGERIHLRNILVPTDFSNESIKALGYGVALAQRFGATLWVAHIVEPVPLYNAPDGITVAVDVTEQTSNAEAQMAEFTAKHVPTNVAVTSLVRYGLTVKEISQLAKDREIDLAIISTHARSGLNRALLGSLAERILHHAPCPVLVVREQEHEFLADSDAGKTIRLNRILTPVDFSDCSKKALRYAEALADQFNAEIFCVHVLEPEKPMIIFETEAFHKGEELEAERKLAAQLQEMDGSIHVEKAIKSGAPYREIVGLAEERQIDLLILGEHCRGVRRWLLGSTIDEVVKHAHCPVLVVRETEHEFVD